MLEQHRKNKHKVAVVGAGVAGCAVAGSLADHGIDFVVFDRHGGPGGLWADNYPNAAGTCAALRCAACVRAWDGSNGAPVDRSR
jgi:cation diffusion facilitator CzcD-associated flavoprotein CzcO